MPVGLVTRATSTFYTHPHAVYARLVYAVTPLPGLLRYYVARVYGLRLHTFTRVGLVGLRALPHRVQFARCTHTLHTFGLPDLQLHTHTCLILHYVTFTHAARWFALRCRAVAHGCSYTRALHVTHGWLQLVYVCYVATVAFALQRTVALHVCCTRTPFYVAVYMPGWLRAPLHARCYIWTFYTVGLYVS